MGSPKSTKEFEKAVKHMDPMLITDYLHKTLDFLKRDKNKLCFPNIPPCDEAFLVNLVTDTRNLKCKYFSDKDRKYAEEIIELLEMSRDVIRWSHSYESGNVNKNLLVYRKIYSNKMKKKPNKPSKLTNRLDQAQASNTPQPFEPQPEHSQNQPVTMEPLPTDCDTISTTFKLKFLNVTKQFIMNHSESSLSYEEMPIHQARYILSLFKNPGKESDVGFGYKSLYAPLWQALEEHGVNYLYEMTLHKTDDEGTAIMCNALSNYRKLLLEKIPRKSNGEPNNEKASITLKNMNIDSRNTSKGTETCKDVEMPNTSTKKKKKKKKQDKSLNTSTASTSSTKSTGANLNVTPQFVHDAVSALIQFAGDAARASVSFRQLSSDEMSFVRKVKGLAASADAREAYSSHFRSLLLKLNDSVNEALKTCKITTTVNEKDGAITLKKTPLFAVPSTQQSTLLGSGARSKSAVSMNSRDRSISKDRMIQFQKGGKTAADNVQPSIDKGTQPAERGRSRDRLNKRTAKLLEDMSTPLESDRGIRMMLLMGWNGGALGARGDGIIEPIIPAIELPPKAGLGHVPPPKPPTPRRPADFRLGVLHNTHDLLLHDDQQKSVPFKDPLTKKEQRFIAAALQCFNDRRPLHLMGRESELIALILQKLGKLPLLDLRADFSQDLKTLTLMKIQNAAPKQPKPQKVKSKNALNWTVAVTEEDADVLVTDYDIETVMGYLDIGVEKVTKKVLRKKAARLLFLMKIADALAWEAQEIRFKFKGSMQKQLMNFLKDMVKCANTGAGAGGLRGEEQRAFGRLQRAARGRALALRFLNPSKFILTITPLFCEDRGLISAERKVLEYDNNNDKQTDNQNTMDDITIVVNNVGHRSINTVEKHTLKDSTYANIDMNINNYTDYHESKVIDIVSLEDENEIVDNNVTVEHSNVKAMDHVVSVNSHGLIRCKNIETLLEAKVRTECDNLENNDEGSDLVINVEEEIEVNHNIETDFKASLVVPYDSAQSDMDRDIEDLEMAMLDANISFNVSDDNIENYNCGSDVLSLKADLHCDVKEEYGNDDYLGDLEVAMSETGLNFDIKKESDVNTSPNSKRSRTSSICSQELDPKRSKINPDDSVVIIMPKKADEMISEDIVRIVQTLISVEIDKAGGFLPLLQCYGIRNGRLIYGCHDDEDVAWLQNIISAANLDLEIVLGGEVCWGKKSRKIVIKINSFIPMDAAKTFKKFETYNAGLDTKHWKVISKQTLSTFVLFIVEVDEKSLKYISNENFSLYCGIDKARFSVIF